ncbi:C-type lectin domain family 9 member A-like [Mobula birostris]|uniref:C-type lectin domain family 9 member A-like n=1 Tax=Mobula birostris TaxID=1983395 RepID=UPI003B280288
MRTELRHQFTDMETKYKSVNETKAQICDFLISRRVPEQACPQDWIGNEDSCYFISTFARYYNAAKEYCDKSESNLFEISSKEEMNFINKALREQGSSYWIGKCKPGNVASHVLYQINVGKSQCSECPSLSWSRRCSAQHRFICERSAPLCLDIPEKIQDLCQQPEEPT